MRKLLIRGPLRSGQCNFSLETRLILLRPVFAVLPLRLQCRYHKTSSFGARNNLRRRREPKPSPAHGAGRLKRPKQNDSATPDPNWPVKGQLPEVLVQGEDDAFIGFGALERRAIFQTGRVGSRPDHVGGGACATSRQSAEEHFHPRESRAQNAASKTIRIEWMWRLRLTGTLPVPTLKKDGSAAYSGSEGVCPSGDRERTPRARRRC